MKKILLPFVFIFTSAVAQKTVYTDPIALAKKEVTELLKIIQLDENQIDTILNLLISKHEELEKNSINKNEIIRCSNSHRQSRRHDFSCYSRVERS